MAGFWTYHLSVSLNLLPFLQLRSALHAELSAFGENVFNLICFSISLFIFSCCFVLRFWHSHSILLSLCIFSYHQDIHTRVFACLSEVLMSTLENKELDFSCLCRVEILVHLVNENLVTNLIGLLHSIYTEKLHKLAPWQQEYLFAFLYDFLFLITDGKGENIQLNFLYHPYPTLDYDAVYFLPV